MNKSGQFQSLQKALGYQFKNEALLMQALSHRSVGSKNNERLEFLGDAVLGFIISQALYHTHPTAKEGALSRLRSALVNGEVLAELANRINLNACLNLGAGELKSGGRTRPSILADAVEAIIGAIFLDAGMDVCRTCVLSLWNEHVEDLSGAVVEKDPKSRLQEWLQARQLPLPHYEVQVSGEAHAQDFEVLCTVEGLPHQTQGNSTSRRKAEQVAAEKYLEIIDEHK